MQVSSRCLLERFSHFGSYDYKPKKKALIVQISSRVLPAHFCAYDPGTETGTT